jgi:hypothetical protein
MRISPKTLFGILFSIGCIAGLSGLQVNRLKAINNAATSLSKETLQIQEENQRLRLDLLKASPTFGFDNLVADWTFLNFLQYFGDDAVRNITGYTTSPEFFKVIVERDPRFYLPYIFLSTSTSIYAAQPEVSVGLMAQGLKSMTPTVPPQSAYVWRTKAMDELLFLGDAEAARQSYLKAAEWAEQSPDPFTQQFADASRQSAQWLENNPLSRSARISAWTQVLNQAVDERTYKLAVQKIQALGGIISQENGQLRIAIPKDTPSPAPTNP